ncbi:GATA transcription factor 5-like isoform X2 [Cucurbita pepo subsp. pepo]|uniref:GATA transcription factor 5-like isoform X2 n=1 Tax=Cucurbita pepo subsp. pepo TaxID=3664 RepID=UPI000C9D8F6C|nr:GATA transcription factor 5-like isoform X2 [Cucurbita pepo subsp. pepo]XP_023512851.1 GATA transcription factor 5-like isoform X2 [Cucurbita pepo subsp. pepo]
MECLEAKALKSSFHWELAMKFAQPDAMVEEGGCSNGADLVAGEDFEVDEFLNFSNGDFEHGSALRVQEDDDYEEFEKNRLSVSPYSNQSGGIPTAGEEGSKAVVGVELAIPGDALADLEWVSQFVDDSGSEYSCAAVSLNRSKPEKKLTGAVISCLPTSFPVRPRTKRPRQSRQAKSTSSSLNQSSSSSSLSSSSGVSSAAPWFIFSDAGENVDYLNVSGQPTKKQRKKSSAAAAVLQPVGPTGQIPRRCSHCLVQRTPQWRTGPNGAKTLCNACGVRYKSGRLFPEYRPALSPTFCSGIHSNSHRKVLEMRKTKEVPEPASDLAPMVPSY